MASFASMPHQVQPSPLWQRLAWQAFERAPAHADAAFGLMRRHLLPALCGPLALQRLTGHCHRHAVPASVVVAGAGMQTEYLARRIFTEPPQVEQLGRCPVGDLHRVLSAALTSCDLVIARVARPATPLFGPSYIQVPGLIGLGYDVGATEDELLRRLSSRQRRYARAIRTQGYGWKVTHGQDDLEQFYHDYYVPSIRERFADLADVQALPILRRQLRFGGIMWLMCGDRRVAGDLYRVSHGQLRQIVKGVRPDLAPEGGPGPHVALHLCATELAKSLGLRRVCLGGSVPSLRDGVLRFKANWGGSLQEYSDSHRDLLIRWERPSAAVQQLLSAAPLIARTPSGFIGVAAGAQADVAAVWKELHVGNLAGLTLTDASGEAASIGFGAMATHHAAHSSEDLLRPWCGAGRC